MLVIGLALKGLMPFSSSAFSRRSHHGSDVQASLCDEGGRLDEIPSGAPQLLGESDPVTPISYPGLSVERTGLENMFWYACDILTLSFWKKGGKQHKRYVIVGL